MSTFEFVVSAENNDYMVWQAMLFHHSCLKATGQAPVIVVHRDDEPMLDGFMQIEQHCGRIQPAPNYRWKDGVHYPPRNTAASLLHVETDADYIVLCDPDMVFLKAPSLQDYTIDDDQVSFDRLTYLDLGRSEFHSLLSDVCRDVGVPFEVFQRQPINGGVPHIVPRSIKDTLAHEWLAMMDAFPANASHGEVIGNVPHIDWTSTMWAVALAVHRLNLRPAFTHFSETNWNDDHPLATCQADGHWMIHYCYPRPGFNKQLYDQTENWSDVWNVPPGDDSIAGEIRRQIREARRRYQL